MIVKLINKIEQGTATVQEVASNKDIILMAVEYDIEVDNYFDKDKAEQDYLAIEYYAPYIINNAKGFIEFVKESYHHEIWNTL